MKKYPKRGYALNPQPLTIYMQYDKVEIKMDFVNQYSYLQEEIYESFLEPMFEELYPTIFLYADHGHDKVTVISITGVILVVGSIPLTWS